MLAAHFGPNSHPPIMVDDTMEISSEYGHRGGEEEIDIDIDFATAPADEDYAIEDAASNPGFADGLQPSVGNDDFMIDEDQRSFVMGDVPDAALDDGDHAMDHSTPMMSFGMGESSHYPVDEGIDDLAVPEIPPVAETEPMWEEHEAAEFPVDDSAPHPDGPEQLFHEEGNVQLESLNEDDTTEVQNADTSTRLPSERDSRTSPPEERNPLDGIPAAPHSPANSVTGPTHLPPSETPKSPNSKAVVVPDEVAKPANFVPANAPLTFTAPPEVLVSYLSSEYTLFAKSGNDDPDSYFLSDISILEKPLGEFFTAIRDIVQEELSEDDELCMSIEDLGFEIEEHSTLGRGANLAQIIRLHEQISRNDGIEPLRPLQMVLGTRANFLRKLGSLTAGAAGGKGLAELMTWDDGSEGVGDLDGVDENTNGSEQDEGDETSGEVSNVPHGETADNFVGESKHASPAPPVSSHYEQAKVENETGGNQHVQIQSNAAQPSSQNNASNESSELVAQAPTSVETYALEYVEDENEDDLIDYSESEHEDLTVQSPDKAKTQTDDSPEPSADDETEKQHQANKEILEIDEYAAETLLVGGAEAEVEHLTTRGAPDAAAPETLNEFTAAYDEPTEHLGQENDSFAELAPEENSYDDEDDFHNLGDGDGLDITTTELHENFEGSTLPPGDLDIPETAESSVTVSADDQHFVELAGYDLDDSKATSESHTLDDATNNGTNDEHEDEIDYEDDAEDKEQASNEALAPVPGINDSPLSNGKRPRIETESDDVQSSKEAKRPRS